MRRHWNFQRLLKPVAVVNPYAEELRYADDRLQSRRDQPKYLNLINAAAFLRQMQKPVKHADGRDYVEVDKADLDLADRLAAAILGRNLDDLNAVSRDLLAQTERMVAERIERMTEPDVRNKPRVEDIQFTRRDIREYTGWPHARVERYLKKLVDMEYLIAHAGKNGKRYLYTLAACTPLNDGAETFSRLLTTFSGPSHGPDSVQPPACEGVGPKPSLFPGKAYNEKT